MPEERKPYSYSFRRRTSEGNLDVKADYESLLSIKQSLLLLTGGCDIVDRRDGVYCEKHGRYLKPGESRCDYVSDHFSRDNGEERSKELMQRYINEIQGVKDPKNIRRLSGQ